MPPFVFVLKEAQSGKYDRAHLILPFPIDARFNTQGNDR